MNRCRSCEAPIVWATSILGKRIPLDADSCTKEEQEARDVHFDPNRHQSHFATCPQAGAWRRRDLE